MEREQELINCIECPKEPGTICMPYKGGRSRLVFRPTGSPEGKRYDEGVEVAVSVSDCPYRVKVMELVKK